MRYQYLLFDMDGMLVDTSEGVLLCAQHALKAFGIQVADHRTLTPFMGPPLSYSFMTFYGMSQEDTERAVAIYRERYTAKGQYECYVFPGVEDMLQMLLKKGYRLCIATSKLESYAVAMLERLGIASYFEIITGATPDGKVSNKDEVIEESIRRMNIPNRKDALMIGDRKYDVLGAKKCGLDSFGVYMGCAEDKEHEKAGATYVAHSIAQLQEMLLQF